VRADRIVILGGQVRRRKLDRWCVASGLQLDWVRMDPSAGHATRALVAQMRVGSIVAIIILDGLADHASLKPVLATSRSLGIPVAYGHKAGIARMRRVLADLDGRLQRLA
jgi:hypothetical protein